MSSICTGIAPLPTVASLGMTWWHSQAWAVLYRQQRLRAFADFVYELADWTLERQTAVNGAFLVDYHPSGPNFLTACMLEGLAEVWNLAKQDGDSRREARYAASW